MNNPFLKRRRKEAIKVLIAQIVILVLFVGLWELLSSLEIIDAFLFSKPSRIVKLLETYIVTKTIYKHIGISLLETMLGLVIGTLAGLLIAIILWWNKIIAKIMEPFLVVLNSLPKIALRTGNNNMGRSRNRRNYSNGIGNIINSYNSRNIKWFFKYR